MRARTAVTAALGLGLAPACRGPGTELVRPSALALGPDGQLAVADAEHGHVVLIDEHGRSLRRGKGDGGYWEAAALAWDADSRLVALARRYSADVDRTTWDLVRFDGSAVSERLPLEVPEPALLDWSMGLALAADGSVFTTGLSGGAVVHFDAQGAYLGHWSEAGTLGAFQGPSALATTEDGLWVVEHFGHRVRRLAQGGHQRLAFGIEGRQEGRLRFPRALAVCGEHWVAVADMGNFRVQRFGVDGAYLDGFEPPAVAEDVPVQLVGLATSADCQRLYLADGRGGRVLVTTLSGELIEVIE